ncbi:MAG: pyridoxamine 5'-phosphate oxidase [Proteobacteria bacterium]|nr:pyridoxamine 5'-phosphate oxidase [Pseudomonadota bacterium]
MPEPITDPFERFAAWFAEAKQAEPNDAEAMTLASASPAGRPSARLVLLKAFDRAGFVFYTNLESRKSLELVANPRAALCFHWKSLRRQVRIEGVTTMVEAADADAYFASRAYGSQIGAWASLQSRRLDARATLERRVAEFSAKYPEGTVPRPPDWSGFRLAPERIEFWRDMPFRLHERLLFTRSGTGWATEWLYP